MAEREAGGRFAAAMRPWEDYSTAVIAVAVSVMLYAVAGADIALWPAAILAPLPILAVAPEMPDWLAARCAFAAYFIGNMAIWPSESFAVPLWELAIFHAAGALLFALLIVLHGEAARRWAGILAALVYPTLTTAAWHGIAAWSPHGTWGVPAYGVSPFLPVMQIAAFTGLSGVTFLMAWVPAGLAIAWYRRRWRMQWEVMAAVPLAAFVAVSALGAIRLMGKDAGAPAMVGLAASDQMLAGTDAIEASDAAPVLDLYAPIVKKLAEQGAQVVVLPEKLVGVRPKYEDEVIAGFTRMAAMNRIWLVVGLNRLEPEPKRNLAIVISASGAVVARYYKHHPIPGVEEGYARGTDLTIFNLLQGRAAVAICKDLDFPALGRRIANAGAVFLLVPAWDWPGAEEIHARMAIALGIESGLSIARAARQGLVTVSDSRGRILGRESTFDKDPAMVVFAMPPGSGPTFYARHGNWFADIILVLAAVLIALLALSVRESPRRP
ncbi:MAG: nitrilase-related carbon-nitrogen hydrolase [Candidatus Binataceae bacterium]